MNTNWLSTFHGKANFQTCHQVYYMTVALTIHHHTRCHSIISTNPFPPRMPLTLLTLAFNKQFLPEKVKHSGNQSLRYQNLHNFANYYSGLVLILMQLVANLAITKWCKKTMYMCTHLRVLSESFENEYQHDRVQMVWGEVASAMEGLSSWINFEITTS